MNKVNPCGEDNNVLDAIFGNATQALAVAESLHRGGYGPYALHFAIICWEECSKYLLAYCKDHLPEKQFKSRYSHVSKYSLGMGIHYLSGGFSVAHLLQELHDSGVWEEGKGGLAALTNALLRKIGYGDPESLARTLMNSLSSEKSEKEIEASKNFFDEAERLRTQSVYVDFGDDLSFQGGPSRISDEEIQRWLEHARLGVGMLTFLRAERPDLLALVASMPESTRKENKETNEQFIADMRAAVQDVSDKQGPDGKA